MKYVIKQYKSLDSVDWKSVPMAPVSCFLWLDNDYRPETYAQVVLVKDYGFVAKMTCHETNPRATCQNTDDLVCFDSCMEFFATFDNKSDKYVNIEMNPIGTVLSHIGPDRYDRKTVVELTGSTWKIDHEILNDSWTVTAHIAFDKLCSLYGITKDVFVSGYTFRGNFYKCGDSCEVHHYGMWNPVELPTPDFHRPEFFGELVIE